MKLPVGLTRTLFNSALKFKEASPTLMFGVGIVAVGTGAVLACRATLKLEELVEETQSSLEDIRTIQHSKYSEQDRLQDKSVVLFRAGLGLTKLYGPSILIGAFGIACLTGSHVTLTKRNAALTAAYAGLERSYNAYRRRVAETIGDDAERNLHYDVEKKELEVYKAEDKRSKKPKGIEGYSGYARFFDESNRNWTSTPEYNKNFLRVQENWANNLLLSRGHLFLNEVYDMLGLERSTAGAVVGWIISKDGDNYVDFGIFDGRTDAARAFVNGYEATILLDFNVDGVIYDKI